MNPAPLQYFRQKIPAMVLTCFHNGVIIIRTMKSPMAFFFLSSNVTNDKGAAQIAFSFFINPIHFKEVLSWQ